MAPCRPIAIAVALLVWGCPKTEPRIAEDIFAQRLGEPLPSASDAQLGIFERGEAVATRRFTPADGLGPDFNVTFCAGCHEKPAFGGGSPRYRDFLLVGQRLPDGSRVDLGVNGVLPQFMVQTTAPHPDEECLDAEGIPTGQRGARPGEGPEGAVTARRPEAPEANHFAKRNAIPFFGVGLLAEIDEEAILRNADEDDRDGDGISGRPNFDRGFVGRFGRKAQTVSIEGFIRGPLFNHLGITSNPLSPELQAQLPVPSVTDPAPPSRDRRMGALGSRSDHQAAAPDDPITDADGVCDPELAEEDLFALVSWAMLLAPPQPAPSTPQSEAGRALFEQARCSACHIPALRGPRGLIPAYSDLLLHDMGPELADGVQMGRAGDPAHCEGGVVGCEFRTQPLWGVVASAPYLHDGRADTLDEAIRWHGGEAAVSRDTYVAMSEGERADLLAFLASLGGADQVSEGLLAPDTPMNDVGALGGPIRPLNDTEAAAFLRGRALFDRDIRKSDGLGPYFNGDSCRACHFDPIIGGAGPLGVNVSRHGTLVSDVFTPPAIGTMAHHHALGAERPPFDTNANVVEARQTPTTLGMGLIDRIPDAAILANEDPDDLDGDGVSGRAHLLDGGRVGRFSWKAGVPSTAEFVRDAMFNELGLTLPDQPGLTFGGTDDDDEVPDPEMNVEDLEAMTFFLNTLAPPPRQHIDETMENAGETIFETIGCLTCHRVMVTEDGTPVPAYSDFLLHDVQAPDYQGIADGMATHREFRTAPLWGLNASAPYMHDGRASSIEQAIAEHFAEAESARQAYEALDADQRARLLAFLRSL